MGQAIVKKSFRKLILIWAIVAPVVCAGQTNLLEAEYFFDVDPGNGSATPVPGFSPATSVDMTFAADASTLTTGMHILGVRVMDATNTWSLPTFTSVYVFANDPAVNETIVAAEYFFDADPGLGNGVPIAGITPGTAINVTALTNAAALPYGMHLLGVRTQNSHGLWSIAHITAFFVDNDPAIEKLEYFIEPDPGLGNGTEITISPATTSVDMNVVIPTSALPNGAYTLGVRALATDDLWGMTTTHAFTICSTATASFSATTACGGDATLITDNSSNVQAGDLYSWDFDSDGTVDATTQGDQSFTFPGPGSYTASLTIDRGGCLDIFTLPVDVNAAPSADAGADQNLCGTDGTLSAAPLNAGETGLWTFLTGSGALTDPADPVTGFTGISASAELEWTVTVTATGCLATDQVIINGQTPPLASFTTNTVCVGAATTFTDNSINTLAGDTYSWDFNSDGTPDDATVGTTSFAYASPGTYTASLEIDRTGCGDTFTATVTVEAIPTADAGGDQDLCVNDAVLTGNVPAAGETGLWIIISGTATITDATDPGTAITGITSHATVLEWTVTNTAGGCSDADQVTIISNQPITAADVNADASLGEASNINVQSGAAVNPGDVLTTTILTQGSKGTAIVESNGTISYTPNEGTVDSDVIAYELCNQCNRCSSANINIDIQNNAPVITPEPVTADGTSVTINLLSIISDPNNNLDPSTLAITQQPISGATATIDASYNLLVDYTGIAFSGTDNVEIEACDFSGDCSTNVIFIDVEIAEDPPVTVFNAISPNGDGKHDFLEIENIEFYPNNDIYIVNRWGDKVFQATGYDNDQLRFQGISNQGGAKELPSGTYYYSIDLRNGGNRINGFLVLKR